MINFKKVEITDKSWINECLSHRKIRTCEYSFGNLFSYGQVKNIEVAKACGCLVSRSFGNGKLYYCFPAGGGEISSALKEVLEDIKIQNKLAVIYGMSQEDAELFNSIYQGEERAEAARDSFDYCYNTSDLINLSGKKYQSKRNHISFFMRNNNWSYETLTSDAIDECLTMSKQWIEEYISDDKSDLFEEFAIINAVFSNFSSLDYKGGIIRADGRVVAYTMGEELDKEHFCVHFEKAFSNVRGAYPIINQQFVEHELSAYPFINREDDVGLENLRKAKLSYHPAYMAEKYEVLINP